MWIHENPEWPDFIWQNETIAPRLSQIRWRQGRLLGRMQSLGFDLRQDAGLNVLTDDVVKSSAIEGMALNRNEVRSSIARRLGINAANLIPSGRAVDGIVEMMLDAVRNYQQPLTKERLFNWHAALFPTGRSGIYPITVANWRTPEAGPMQVVSGPYGQEKIHFQAPAAERLEAEMTRFLTWYEHSTTIDPVLKAGIAHFWFVTIHPFEDGNGRIARAVGDMALSRADNSAERFYSLSRQIEQERQDYYQQLESQQRGTLDITEWLTWFLDCIGRALDNAETSINRVLFKSSVWEKLNQHPVNDRQRAIINRMLEDDFEGFMNTGKYAKLAKCSNDTALRDIQLLKAWGIFMQNPGKGRSVSYRIELG